jgi:hypothetical protein
MKRLRLYFIFLVVLIYFLGQYLYNIDIVANYSYLGFEKINFKIVNFLYLILISFFVPLSISKPSDSLLIFYFLVILSCLIFTQPLVNSDLLIKTIYISFIVFPFFFMIFLSNFNFKFIPLAFNLSLKQFNFIIYFLLIISFGVLSNYGLKNGGFGFENLYERRIEGRILSGRFTGYLVGFVSNILLAYFSFNFGIKKQKLYLLISISIVLLAYYTLGMKSSIMTLLLFWFIGFSYNKKINFSIVLTIGILILVSLSLVEHYINGISLINLFTIRRIFVVQAEVTQFYFDLFLNYSSFKEKLIGVNIPSNYSDLTYYIGEKYLGNQLTNANTNTFIYFLTKFGILGYLACTITVSFLIKYFDQYYSVIRGSYLILSASVFSYLITEQSFTVTLVSSGLGIFSLLTILFYDGYRHKLN